MAVTRRQRDSKTACQLALLALVALACPNHAQAGDAVIVYIPGWSQGYTQSFDVARVDLTGVTHVTYAFSQLDDNGNVFDGYGNAPLYFSSIRARYPAIRMLLSVGGGGFSTATWTAATSTAPKRARFIANLITYANSLGAAGIDVDWEFPNPNERLTFTAFLRELRAALDADWSARGGGPGVGPPRPLLTAALPGITSPMAMDTMGLDVANFWQYLDYLNLMTYTMHDACYWETETHFHTGWSDCVTAVEWYKKAGVPASRLLLGLASYGHVYTLLNAKQYMYPSPSVELRDCGQMKTRDYYEILASKDSSGGRGGIFLDAGQRSAYYVSGTTWIGFDIEETLWMKKQGAAALGLGGVMLWEVTLDKLPGQPLLKAITSNAPPPTRPCGNGYVGNGQCASLSQCCSEFGWCGTAPAQCGTGCRSGPCGDRASPPPKPVPSPPLRPPPGTTRRRPPSPPKTRTKPPPLPRRRPPPRMLRPPPTDELNFPSPSPSPNPTVASSPPFFPTTPRFPPSPKHSPPPAGEEPPTCGDGVVGNGRCAEPSFCCSMYGYCGWTPLHCGAGCRGGACTPQPPYPPGGVGTCGNGDRGNGRCELPWECCSKYGWCANDAEHCNNQD